MKSKIDKKGHLVEVYPHELKIKIQNKIVSLSKKEIQLLIFLINNARRVVNKFTLMQYVWEYNSFSDTNTIEVHICALRKKLNRGRRKLIKTVYGAGYMFDLPSSEVLVNT